MKNKTEGGRISIVFSQNEGCLCAEVSDNGPGMGGGGRDENASGHKSVGMMLTERRLEMLAGRGEGQVFQEENIAGTDESAQGTRVRVRIPLA
jgi:sensor histidine kinase YesM